VFLLTNVAVVYRASG